jgi:predicted nucleotidyltransferase
MTITFFDILKKTYLTRKKYLDNLESYLIQIKDFFTEEFKDVDVYVFGSVLGKDFGPKSDIDILVVSSSTPSDIKDKAEIISKLKDKIGRINPFEFHLTTPLEYENWYSKFIKEKRRI